VLLARRSGNARLYRIDSRCPLLEPLTALVVAAIGQEAALRGAIEDVEGLQLVFLTGQGNQTTNDPRLVVVGDVPLESLGAMTSRAESALRLPASTLEVAFFQPDDWRTRIAQHNSYVWELLTGPRLMLLDTGARGGR
jgi:hypothetical protein